MKILIIINLIFTLSNSVLFAQDLTEINKSADLSDSLTSTEIRIYKTVSFKGTDIFRMYKCDSIWKTDFFETHKKSRKSKKFKSKKHALISRKKLDTIWWDILKTNIQGIPNMSEIRWKLRKPYMAQFDKTGQKKLFWSSFDINDGESYIVELNFENESKKIKYRNPYIFFRAYPNIDELIYFTELIDIISNEFNIWKNN